MANEKLFIEWLQKDLTHFVSLVEEGSAAAGDPWQNGFSDHDLTIVVAESLDTERAAVYQFLEQYPIGDECLVNIVLAKDYSRGNTMHDLSHKFRAKVLVGSEVIATKALPDRKLAKLDGKNSLLNLTGTLQRRWLNLASWSNEHAHEKNYPVFKQFFVFYGAYHYGRTGNYPVTRAELATTLPDRENAQLLLAVTNDIAHADKPAQKAAIEAALNLIEQIL